MQSIQQAIPPQPKPRVAIIGSGIAGLSAAWHLKDNAHITLFDSENRAGGHAHTVDVTINGQTFGVDTGFLVFNRRTYPGLTPFFEQLGVATSPSDMGFSVQAGNGLSQNASNNNSKLVEWAGNNLNSVFSQRRNLFKIDFWRMLRDIVRFNAAATAYAQTDSNSEETLGQYLKNQGYSDALRDWYLVPMAAAIWSCPTATMMNYPMATFARFCHNHGLLQITNRPQWFTVRGGSRHYVEAVLAQLQASGCDIRLGQAVTAVLRQPDFNPPSSSENAQSDPSRNQAAIQITSETQQSHADTQAFDAVIFACHSDQALALLGENASPLERQLLGAVAYQSNTAVLHTDASVLPSQRRAWAAWNYQTSRSSESKVDSQQVCLHYLINKLQPLPVSLDHPVIVSLNPLPHHQPDPKQVLRTFEYAHPVFNTEAIAAQTRLLAIQGSATGLNTWFAGAWTQYGFHEDGFQSGKAAALGLKARLCIA